ncbi:MAG: hypothetical protein JNJ54_31965 [Myxococcaceae bacterium]|nr:hypothetical protein [Myxococcaceae bacterium]
MTLLLFLCSCGGGAGTLDGSLGPVLVEREEPPLGPRPNPFDPRANPCLEVGARLVVPETTVGCAPSSVDVVISNRCGFEVRLSSSRAGAVGFSALPRSLRPGASGSATVRVLPMVAGPVRERLTLTALADGFAQETSLLVEGTAVSARRVASEQVVQRSPPVELLVVIDDDGVFEAEENFSRLARYFASAGDVRVVVSDLTGAIQRPDGVSVLVSESPTFIDRFTRATRVTRTPGVRSCHETARRLMAAREPAGFWSAESPHAVICITNELDESDLPGSVMVGQWQGRPGLPVTSFSLVAPFGARPCGALDARLDLVRDVTVGVREELCSPGWSSTLESYSRSGFGFRRWFHLPSMPAMRSSQSLEVSVDGVVLPQVDGLWRFDGATGAVVFGPLSSPYPGATLRATWETCE